jgi:hypothetical protein
MMQRKGGNKADGDGKSEESGADEEEDDKDKDNDDDDDQREDDDDDEREDEHEDEREDDRQGRNKDTHRHSELIRLGAAGAGKSGKIGVWRVYVPGRPVITDPDIRSRIPARLLNAELTCPICLSIVRMAHTFMECLHRFCQECIEKYLRLQKECPK